MSRINHFLFLSLLCFVSTSFYTNPPKRTSPVLDNLKEVASDKQRSGVQKVDCLYVINLDRRFEKWKRVDRLFKEYGITANRFSAIDGRSLKKATIAKLFGDNPVRLLKGQIGCLLSHLSVIADGHKNNYDVIWICEDDIELKENPHVISSLIRELTRIDPFWDLLYTDVDSKDSDGNPLLSIDTDCRPDYEECKPQEYYLKRIPITDNLMQIRRRFGMYSVLISKKGMRKIIEYYSDRCLWSPIDVDIHFISRLKEYSATREIITVWSESPFSDTVNE